MRRNLYSTTSVPCPSFFKCSPIVKNSMNHLFLSRYVIAVKSFLVYTTTEEGAEYFAFAGLNRGKGDFHLLKPIFPN